MSFKPNLCQKDYEILVNGKCQYNDITDLPSSVNISKGFNLQWGFDKDDSSIIIFKQTLNLRSWMGLGFNKQMAGADMVITQIQDEVVTIYEGITFGHSPPTPNPDQSDIKILGGEFNDESTVVKFSRKMKPSIKGYAQLEKDEFYQWIAAHSPADSTSDVISYHKSNHFDFVLKLSDNFTPTSPLCDNDTVYISGKCVKNDISDLSSSTQFDAGFTLAWTVNSDKNYVDFLITLNFQSWVGIGFGKKMKGSDMIIGQIFPHDIITVYEGIGLGHQQPIPNKEQYDLKILGYKFSENETIIKFRRDMTTDIEGVVQLKEGEYYDIIGAHSNPKKPQNQIAYHGASHYSTEINLQNHQQ